MNLSYEQLSNTAEAQAEVARLQKELAIAEKKLKEVSMKELSKVANEFSGNRYRPQSGLVANNSPRVYRVEFERNVGKSTYSKASVSMTFKKAGLSKVVIKEIRKSDAYHDCMLSGADVTRQEYQF